MAETNAKSRKKTTQSEHHQPPPSLPAKDAPPVHDDAWQKSAWRSRVRKRLTNWFSDSARELPWRSDPQPYFVWISEIMCQQTQVATVLPYFERFLKSYPTISALAAADEADLMKLWEGLGYYRRARSLHAAAKQIVEFHDGVFPESFDDVLALPGIGRYTAGAILSISGDQRLPILEGNTQRVFSRWIALESPPTETAANRLLWQIAEAMLPPRRAVVGSGTFNQAAMELGALICKPKEPLCDQCPVSNSCAARRLGRQSEIPGKVSKTVYEDRDEFAFVIGDALSGFLMRKLPEGGRWAGLWDFPRPTESEVANLDQAQAWLEEELGRRLKLGTRLTTIRHGVTKYRIRLNVHLARPTGKNRLQPSKPWQTVSLAEMKQLPLSVTGRRIAKLLSD